MADKPVVVLGAVRKGRMEFRLLSSGRCSQVTWERGRFAKEVVGAVLDFGPVEPEEFEELARMWGEDVQ